MRPQRLDDLPDAFELRVAVDVGVVVLHLLRGHAHRQDDVAVLLAAGAILSHDAPDRLDDVDDRLPSVEEDHRIEGRDVDPLGKAARVREDAAVARLGVGLEPVESLLACERVHRAVDVVEVAAHHAGRLGAVVGLLINGDQVLEDVRRLLRELDRLGEGHRPAHRLDVFGERLFLTVLADRHQALLGEPLPAPDDLGREVDVDRLFLVQAVGVVEVVGELGHLVFTDGDDQHLVLGEQIELDGLAKAEAVERGTEGLLVIHREKHRIGVVRLGFRGLGVDPRRGRHVQPLGADDVLVVMNLHELRRALARQRQAGRAVSLVTDDQIERP